MLTKEEGKELIRLLKKSKAVDEIYIFTFVGDSHSTIHFGGECIESMTLQADVEEIDGDMGCEVRLYHKGGGCTIIE